MLGRGWRAESALDTYFSPKTAAVVLPAAILYQGASYLSQQSCSSSINSTASTVASTVLASLDLARDCCALPYLLAGLKRRRQSPPRPILALRRKTKVYFSFDF